MTMKMAMTTRTRTRSRIRELDRLFHDTSYAYILHSVQTLP
jgi:hypothetical protein